MNETVYDAVGSTAPDDKTFRNLQAEFALQGHQLHRTADDRPEYFCTRWGAAKYLANLDEARAFLRQIGGAA